MFFKTKIEICEMPEDKLAARTRIKMSALKISSNDDDNNGNGINWVENYVEDNIKSFIGAPYKVCFIDDSKTIPSGHGSMEYDDDGNVSFPDSDTVGTIMDARIEKINIDNEEQKLVVTEGYLFNQSYPNFINWLKEESNNGTIFGSVEINGKGDSKKIIYSNGTGINEDGTSQIGRKPQIFDFTALAILSDFVPPADESSRILEINSKESELFKMDIVKEKCSIEINKLSYDDIATLITRAINISMGCSDRYCCDYYIYRFYPITSEIVFKKWDDIGKYYMTTYSINIDSVNIGDIIQVEENWQPVNSTNPIEINAKFIKEILINQKGGNNSMNVEELNAKITELSTQLTELNNKVTELNSANSDKDVKIAELNEAIVNANKIVEETNAKLTEKETELNTCKGENEKMKAEMEAAKKEKNKVEVNAYFETEIVKNGFDEAEINSLKSYVDAIDLDGLKKAESELCTKKFKELHSKKEEKIEINSKEMFIPTVVKEKKDINDKKISFFED